MPRPLLALACLASSCTGYAPLQAAARRWPTRLAAAASSDTAAAAAPSGTAAAAATGATLAATHLTGEFAGWRCRFRADTGGSILEEQDSDLSEWVSAPRGVEVLVSSTYDAASKTLKRRVAAAMPEAGCCGTDDVAMRQTTAALAGVDVAAAGATALALRYGDGTAEAVFALEAAFPAPLSERANAVPALARRCRVVVDGAEVSVYMERKVAEEGFSRKIGSPYSGTSRSGLSASELAPLVGLPCFADLTFDGCGAAGGTVRVPGGVAWGAASAGAVAWVECEGVRVEF